MILHHLLDGPDDAPVLVLGGSLGTSVEMWEPQLGDLARDHRVLRYDRRGHGRSAVRPGPATLDDLGADILGLLDTLELERISFCGLSLGGLEGMWLATHAPERIDRLALCCTTASFGPSTGWLERAALVRARGLEPVADAVLGRWFRPSFGQERPDVVERYRAMLLSTVAEGYAACCEAIAGADMWPRLSEITAPTLVVTGADDPVVPPETGDALAAAVAGATHVVISQAAHIANVEQPERFTQALSLHLTTTKEPA